MKSPSRRLLATLIVILLVVIVGIWLRRSASSTHAAVVAVPARDLDEALHRLRNQLEFPGVTVADAAKNLLDAQAIFKFVKDGVGYTPYRGEWAGDVGALRTRTGNSTDKALLLDSLLKARGYQTRMLRADWPSNAVPYVGVDAIQDLSEVAEVKRFLANHAETSQPAAPDFLAAARAEATATTAAVGAALVKNHVPTNLDEVPDPRILGNITPAPETDWVWVEYRSDPSQPWTALDPTFPTLPRPEKPTISFAPVPSQLTVELMARLKDGREQSVVRWAGPTSQALGYDISLSFLPAVSSPERLQAMADPAEVGFWCPVLQIGPTSQRGAAVSTSGALLERRDGAIQLQGEPVLTEAEIEGPSTVTPISKLAVTSVDASRYPRLRVRMAVEATQKPAWRNALFDVHDLEAATKRLPVTIESASVEQRPLILLVDTSGSMNDGRRVDMAKLALKSLIAKVGPQQRVGLITFSSGVTVGQKVAPLGKIRADLIKSIDAMNPSGGTSIMEAIQASVKEAAGPAIIVLLTDGQDDGKGNADDYAKRIAATNDAVAASRSVLYPVGIGEADDALLSSFARQSGTPYIHASDVTRLPGLYDSMASSLSGGVVVRLMADRSAGAQPGSTHKLSIAMAGYPTPVEATYQVPAKPAKPDESRLFLRIEVQEGGQPTSRTYSRPLFSIGPGQDAWRMLSSYDLGFSVGPIPAKVVAARQIDKRIDLLNMQATQHGGALPTEFAARRGLSARSAEMMTVVARALPSLAAPDQHSQWCGPTVLLESRQLLTQPEGAIRRDTIDFMATCYGLDDKAPRKARISWGASLGALESEMLGGTSVNHAMLQHPDALVVGAGQEPGGSVIRSTAAPNDAWVLAGSSELYPMLIGDPEAKGASVDQIVKEFKRLHSLLSYMGAAGSGVLSMAGLPGSAWTGLCTFFDEELKLWCYSSVMLGYVGEGIEAGSFDAASSEKSAQECCGLNGKPDHFGMNLTNALVAGFVAGVGEDAFGGLISDPLADIFGTHPIVSGISGGLVSLNDPFPGLGTDFLNDLTSAVSPSRPTDAPAAPQHGSEGK